MSLISTVTVLIVGAVHIAISVVEIFFWQNPLVYQRFDFTAEIASKVAPIVQNAGLYNSFIAAGLIWGAFAKSNSLEIRVFFLVCVIIAGIFGALTLKWTTLVLQTLPAFVALAVVWLTHSRLKFQG
jgi:putative membrane protein